MKLLLGFALGYLVRCLLDEDTMQALWRVYYGVKRGDIR